MFPPRQAFHRSRLGTCRRVRRLCVLIVLVSVIAPLPITHATSAAAGRLINSIRQSLVPQTALPQNVSRRPGPEHTEVPRFRILIGESRAIPFEMPITSALVVFPEIATAELNSRSVLLTGVRVGETILIVFDGQLRYTFLVEVVGRTQATTNRKQPAESATLNNARSSGSYTVSYSAPFGPSPTVFRQKFEFRRTLTQGRTFRFSSDLFKFMGQGDVRATIPRFGLNYMSLGIDGPSGTLDLLDSEINLSSVSFNNYAMRGFHMVSSPDSRLRGVELFAGVARPALSFFDKNQGRLLGALFPVVQTQSWQVRAGFFNLSPRQDNRLGRGGTVWQLIGRYAPNKNIAAEGEAGYANGGLSWRLRFDLISRSFNGYGEIFRLGRRSPLISIGAQPGGREAEAFAFQWRPGGRFGASFNYNHTAVVPPANAGRAILDRSTLFATTTYRLAQSSRLHFRYGWQQIETRSAGGPHFRVGTDTATISHDIRFNQRWANNLEARLTSSRETNSGSGTERGIDLKNELRFSFDRGSATGFVNYTRRIPSLAGLIVRNPQLLPPLLQREFTTDPVRFLQTNRDLLGFLLPGIELPQTRGLDAGVRLQTAFSRINFGGEVRYSTSEILAHEQRNVDASVSMNIRLDAANSVQVSGWRSLAFNSARTEPMFTISYVHRFGAGSGGGFQFSKLFGTDRGVIQGRVFFDLNGNGRDDEREPGVANMTVQVDGDRTAITDRGGRFRFQTDAGEHSIAIISGELGVRLKATSATAQNVSLSGRSTVEISFGVSNFGSISGRIFNDLFLTGQHTAGNSPGVAGVSVRLSPIDQIGNALNMTVDGGGTYHFRNLPPGSYNLEIDPATLPPDFRTPSRNSWIIEIKPLETFYLDLPQVAERAVTGVVFIDKNGNGAFDADIDETVEGARVLTGRTEGITGQSGTYLLRSLPAGRIEVRSRTPWGTESLPVALELPAQPVTRRAVNLIVRR